jgi:hypothetical protein
MANLVTNPGFESAMTGWTATSTKMKESTIAPYAGSYACNVIRNNTLTQRVSGLKSNTTYRLSAYLRGNQDYAIMSAKNFGGTTVSVNGGTATTYESKFLTFKTGASNTFVDIVFSHGGLVAWEWMMVDNVSLTEEAAPTCNLSTTCTPSNFSAAAGSQNLCISATNTGWSLSESASWLSLSATSGTATATVSVSVTANTATSARSATITLSPSSCASVTPISIVVTQAAQSPSADYLKLDGTTAMTGNLNMGSKDIIGVKNVTLSGSLKINDWTLAAPDYVFEPGYALRSLEQVEAYIAQNKHLPEVPSAAELRDNGVEVLELNMTLLKKVEELTLYVIEQNKKIEAQAQRLEQIDTRK